MFIVRHLVKSVRTEEPDIENLYMAERITYHPVASNLGALELRTGENLVAALWGGRAYVMNERGDTVASYHKLPDKA
jgi:hypothetical protein